VRMTESVDRVIRDVESTATIPALQSGIRAELNHAEGHRRTWVGMSMPSRPDEGIHFTMVSNLC